MVEASPHFLRRESRAEARRLGRIAVGWVLFSVSPGVFGCSKSPGDGLAAPNVQAAGDTFEDRFPAPQFKDRFPTASESLVRSEEHTSELQSRLHLVCRPLLAKKRPRWCRRRRSRAYKSSAGATPLRAGA